MAKLRGSYKAAEDATKATIKLAADQIDSLIAERDRLKERNAKLIDQINEINHIFTRISKEHAEAMGLLQQCSDVPMNTNLPARIKAFLSKLKP